MTDEDLNQIAALLSAAEQRLTALLSATEQRLTDKQDAAIEMVAGEISGLRQEMDRRFDSTDRRLERVENQLYNLTLQSLGMSKSLTDAERLDSATAATLASQQKAIDDLYAKLAALTRRLEHPPQQ
ncbi:MAG TPA: hypothetical protein VE959_16040 [Bryobacteraceae bacterium]|nr:hypothetical protein [Bryobacteraceae bacterium]